MSSYERGTHLGTSTEVVSDWDLQRYLARKKTLSPYDHYKAQNSATVASQKGCFLMSEVPL